MQVRTEMICLSGVTFMIILFYIHNSPLFYSAEARNIRPYDLEPAATIECKGSIW